MLNHARINSNPIESKSSRPAKNMLNDGANSFTEFGPGKVLCGLIKKVDREVKVQSAF